MPATYEDLQGKSVFITGGGSGIGAALTDGFLAQGAKVAIVGRSDASAFCDRMQEKHGNRPVFHACDISDIPALKSAMKDCAAEIGTFSVLINNAANDQRHETLDVTEEFWDRSQAINLKAYFFACQAAIPGMKQLGGGAIVNMTSISYMMGNAGYPSYASANAGITGLTRALAREFGPDQIRVNAIAPGWVMTERQRELWATDTGVAAHLERQCLPRTLTEPDMVGPCLFLASEQSAAVTSQVLVADGGVVATG